ncbi:Kcna4 [Symbiodinium pilosum]|uniref:Kcna4 protein n=1 Tax=Symbiodinium pilosum TaxID=2952 RepID=A0A812MUD4_SYMPI|nr:Kcna4 [Symbiodinium pilosum]
MRIPTAADNLVAHSLLVCYVPVVRQLKLIRRFQKLQLLLHVLSTTLDALKLLLFLVCLIVLFFGTMLYMLEPADTTTLPTYIYWCTVTVTTVGTCDMAPVTWPGKVMAGILCLISVLFMAMPLSVLGNAMSKTWDDRHRILLMTQTRRRLKHLGYSADDMPKLFKKFDRDGNGELEMEEFCDACSALLGNNRTVLQQRLKCSPQEAQLS